MSERIAPTTYVRARVPKGCVCSAPDCARPATLNSRFGLVCKAHWLRISRRGTIDPHRSPHMSSRAEYRHWINMKSRCNTPSSTGWEHYGGRGIVVCERWQASFEDFYADMGSRPSPKHSLDRYPDTNGNYEPGNVRWATPKEQARNKRRNRYVGGDGKKVILTDAIKASGLKQSTVANRLRRGWPMEAALTLGLRRGLKYAP